jgi:hypothetical protein
MHARQTGLISISGGGKKSQETLSAKDAKRGRKGCKEVRIERLAHDECSKVEFDVAKGLRVNHGEWEFGYAGCHAIDGSAGEYRASH